MAVFDMDALIAGDYIQKRKNAERPPLAEVALHDYVMVAYDIVDSGKATKCPFEVANKIKRVPGHGCDRGIHQVQYVAIDADAVISLRGEFNEIRQFATDRAVKASEMSVGRYQKPLFMDLSDHDFPLLVS